MSKNSFIFPNTQNQPKTLLTIDWLTLNVNDNFSRLEIPESNTLIIGEFTLEYLPDIRTRHFNKYFKLWYKSEVVAVITSDSNSKKMLCGRSHVKIENHFFYNGELQDLITKIVDNFFLVSVKISRLDLALDGCYLHNFLNKFLYEDNFKYDNLVIGRVNDIDNITPIGFTRDNIKSCDFENFVIGSWGNKNLGTVRSEKFGRYYNKSKELRQIQKKEYITEYYKNNGFDLSKDVYRFEVQLSSSYISKVSTGVEILDFKEVDILFSYHDLFSLDSLKTLFQTSLKNWFEFYLKDNKRVDRCTRIVFFSDIQKSVYSKIIKVVKDKVRTIKVMINRLVKDVLFGSLKDSIDSIKDNIRETVMSLIERYHIYEWFKNTFPYHLSEIKKRASLEGIKLNYKHTNLELWTM